MSFLRGTSNLASADLKQLNINSTSGSTNQQADPLPYLAGCRRFSGTFISDAFNQSNDNASEGKSGGKGGGSSQINYYAGFAVAFCVGPCDSIQGLYLNGDDVFTDNTQIVAQSLREVNNLATFTAEANHNLTTGQSVLVNGADQTEFNGEFTVTVTSPTQFQYTIPGEAIQAESASGSGSSTGNIYAYAKLDPIYRGNEDHIDVTIPGYGTMRLYWGTETQTADAYLLTSGVNQPPMHGVCYGIFEDFFLGLNQTNIQNVEIVLSRTPTAPWQANAGENDINDEANPAIIFYDLLTNPRAGIGLTAADFNIAQLAAACTRFATEGLGISPIITRSDTLLSTIQQLCESVDAIPVLDAAGLLSLIPIRPPANYAALPTLTDIQLAELPQLKAQDWSNTCNQTRIVFPNNDAAWNDDFVEWFDFGSISATQKIAQPNTLSRDWITDRSIALALVQAAGLTAAVPAFTGTLTLLFTPALWTTLIPGTLFINNFVTMPRANGIFRITKRTFNKSDQPTFTIEFQADRSYFNIA